MQKAPSEYQHLIGNGLVPVVIGITGHRDIPAEDVDALKSATKKILRGIERETPHSPHVLISPLAEGADRIAAHAALEMGWTLGVILPAPVSLYKEDFPTETSRREFSDLMERAAWIEELPAQVMNSPTYRAVGIKIARHSLYLIAFWDGDKTIVEGGTADIVDLFLHGIPEETLEVDADNFLLEARPVFHVLTRRSKDMTRFPVAEVGHTFKLSPNPEEAGGKAELGRWTDVTRNIDQFNADAGKFQANSEDIKTSLKYLDPGTKNNLLPPALAPAANLYALADVISQNTQEERNKSLLTLISLTGLAVLLEQIYSGPDANPFVLLAAILAGILAWTVFRFSERRRLESCYLDYRSLAEACRVQYFWRKAGIRASVVDHFLRDQRDELEWIRRAVRTTELLPLDLSPSSAKMHSVSEAWLKDQQLYFIGLEGLNKGNKARFNQLQNDKWSMISGTLFKVGLIFTFVIALVHWYLQRAEISAPDWVISAAPLLYGLLFASAGLVKVYQEIKAFDQHANQYRRMGLALSVARRRLNAALEANDLHKAERILIGAGRDALEENGNWLLLHRARPVEVPLG